MHTKASLAVRIGFLISGIGTFAQARAEEVIVQYLHDPSCRLLVYQDQKWTPVEDPAPLQGLTFAESKLKRKDASVTFLANKLYYHANAACLKPAGESVIPKKKSSRNLHLGRSVGLAFDTFSQPFTASGSDGNAYPLVGRFSGLSFGVYQLMEKPIKSRLSLSGAIEGFLGFASVTENLSGTPTPIFSYSAKNYLQFGARAFGELDYSFKKWMFSLMLGAGLSYVSLPAPIAAIPIAAPSLMRLLLSERLLVHYFLKPDLSVHLGVGALGSPGNLEIMIGVRIRK
jgi:hypothetical protein